MTKLKIAEYITDGHSLFEKWFSGLDANTAAKVASALYRMEQGNLSNVKSAGKGVLEYKIDFGPGYRIYFGMEGNELIILLGGGSKKTQDKDIKKAHALWFQYKANKKAKH
ncbi:MAG: type II toxin-antitoxin system RelE/ParE family toxin [Nitrospirae bacterium]|nr:type II toxin-antitoxin system RelE/ParE family toxin [Nitrospirota bacterium]MBI3377755.1 type II toxin-antitoxin system RelE/ParE family toxin [Nitrospirota bacterium]